MSLRSLLNQPVTIVHPTVTPWKWDSSAVRVATVGRLDWTGTSEETSGFPADSPDTTVATWQLFLGPAETIGPNDRVERGADVFEVVGQPDVVSAGRRVHHLEVQLRSVV